MATGSLISRLMPIFPDPRKKTTLIFAFRQPFRGPDGVKYVAKNASI